MFRLILTGLAALAAPLFLSATLGLGALTLAAAPALAQHKMDADDMELPIDDPNLQAMTAAGTAVFSEAVAMVADALGVELDDIVCEAEHAQTPTDLKLGS